MRYLTFLLWQARLWLVGYGQRVRDREQILAIRTTWDEHTPFARFLDWLSPFSPEGGYKRRPLRRWLYRARHPIEVQCFWSLALVQSIVYRLVPRPSLGRYEFGDAGYQLRAEWLDTHSEYADYTTGDSGWGMWYALFDRLDVPWSLQPETWLMKVDSQGFVGVEQYSDPDEAMADFQAYDRSYVYDPENVDEFGIGPDGPDDFNIEGQPEFNGAFGIIQ